MKTTKEILKDTDIMKQLILSKLCKKAKPLEDIDFEEEEMKCRRITTTTNTVTKQKFIVDVGVEAEYPSLRVLLQNVYEKQGELYKKEFGVDYEDAYDAGWEPDVTNFCGRGWYTFLRDRGVITRARVVEVVKIVDLVRELMDNEDGAFVQ